MSAAFEKYFQEDIEQLTQSLNSIDVKQMDELVDEIEDQLEA